MSVTPGWLGGKGSLRVFDSMVKIGCQNVHNGVVGAGSIMVRAKLERVGANKIATWRIFEEQKQTTL